MACSRLSPILASLAAATLSIACSSGGSEVLADTTTGVETDDDGGPGSSEAGVGETGSADDTGDPTDTGADETGETGETADTGDDPDEPLERARVFFSGHSLLDNPMPDYVDSIATSLGKDIDWNQQNGIGSPIRVRTWGNGGWAGYSLGKNRVGSDMDVIQELLAPQTLGAGELYDTLLITERHDLLGTIQWENTIGYLRHYHDRLIDGNPDGVTYLYHTWLDVDKANPAAWISYEKHALVAWECVASKVNLTLAEAGRPDRVIPEPGGAALVDLVERILADEVPGLTGTSVEKLNHVFSDNVHLTGLGVYFMAAVHHAAIFRDSPVGAEGPQNLDPAVVEALQTIAWNFVSHYYAQPNAGVRAMEDCRTRVAQDVCPGFWTLLGQPQNIAGCQSYFGDANPGPGGNPFVWPDPNFMELPRP